MARADTRSAVAAARSLDRRGGPGRTGAAWLCPTLCLAWLATGCTGPSRESVLDPMIGEDIETAIQTFGPPAETVELEDGERAYLWRRVYKYDKGRRARSWPDRRVAGWTDEPGEPADARVCSTRLVTDFALRIRSWDYGCETVIVDRRRAATTQGDDPAVGEGQASQATGDPATAGPGPDVAAGHDGSPAGETAP